MRKYKRPRSKSLALNAFGSPGKSENVSLSSDWIIIDWLSQLHFQEKSLVPPTHKKLVNTKRALASIRGHDQGLLSSADYSWSFSNSASLRGLDRIDNPNLFTAPVWALFNAIELASDWEYMGSVGRRWHCWRRMMARRTKQSYSFCSCWIYSGGWIALLSCLEAMLKIRW